MHRPGRRRGSIPHIDASRSDEQNIVRRAGADRAGDDDVVERFNAVVSEVGGDRCAVGIDEFDGGAVRDRLG